MVPYKSFAHTVSGISHTKHGKECQDACAHFTESGHSTNDMSLAVVADGHGDDNCFRSAKGAELAAACAVRGMADFVKYLNESEEKARLLQIKKPKPRKEEFSKEEIEKLLREKLIRYGIISAWYKLAAEHFTNFPFTEAELANVKEKYQNQYAQGKNLHHAYGATLIAAAVTKDYWFGFHIGDGRLTALYPDGSFDQPVPWDEKCNLNVTTSICDDDVYERSRCYFSFHAERQPPVAVFLCTDGIDDNYPVEGNEKHLFKLYRTIAITFAEDGFDSTCNQLKDLAKSFATKGKGDDTSIAILVDMEGLKKTVPIWKQQITEEEAAAMKAEEEAIKEKEAVKAAAETEDKSAVDVETHAAISAYKKQKDFSNSRDSDASSYGDFFTPKKE